MVKDLGARVSTNLETFGQYSLTFLAPSVWNSLPAERKSAPLHAHFRSLIKIHPFCLAFGPSAYVLYVLVCFSMCGYVSCTVQPLLCPLCLISLILLDCLNVSGWVVCQSQCQWVGGLSVTVSVGGWFVSHSVSGWVVCRSQCDWVCSSSVTM